jgi:hypothetical protein
MVAAEEWSGDLRIVVTRLSCAGRVLAKALQEREAAAKHLWEYGLDDYWAVIPDGGKAALKQWPWLEEVT